MPILTNFARTFFHNRMREIDEFRFNAKHVQDKQFKKLINLLSKTSFGISSGIDANCSYDEFCKKISIVEYSDIAPLIDRMRGGEKVLLTPHDIKWYAKSSGTTDTKSKFIPVPNIHLKECHYKGTKDVLAIFTDNYPNSNIFSGKSLTLGGSHMLDECSLSGAHYGDLSAILIQNAPMVTESIRMPSKASALIPDFERKIEAICKECCNANITSIAGVPSWNMVMLNKVLEYTGKNNISEVWENLELFMHGGISFKPYRTQFEKLIPSPKMKYIETYNASEGFFAIQDDPTEDDMLLMLDYGVFYEFLDTKYLNDYSKAVPLEGVEIGVNYAMIISTLGGLWRYMIGDTVAFSSKEPYKIRITGRTKLFINAFGEEVIIDNTDKALLKASKSTGAQVADYTVAPIFMDGKSKGSHQWIIEFNHDPNCFDTFCRELDIALQACNSDYEAKRQNDTTLYAPTISKVANGTFYNWMQNRNKLGGQNKVPRLSNERAYVEELLNINMMNLSSIENTVRN